MLESVSESVAGLIPPGAEKLLLVLLLSFLIGVDREEHKKDAGLNVLSFGGVRTFTILGLIGYAVALISDAQPLAIGLGLLAVTAFAIVSFKSKIEASPKAGLTSEVSGLFTYLIGPLIYREHYWLTTAMVVVCLLLLELKTQLESLVQKMDLGEAVTLTKFLLLSAVILPILPNQEYSDFHINPFKTWLIVVAISGLSYGSYLLQKALGKKSGVLLSAILGGAYSSTVATVVLAKRAKDQPRPHLFSGAILAASGVMYMRLAILLSLFSEALRESLSYFLFAISGLAIIAGILWSRRQDPVLGVEAKELEPNNPLQLSSAFFFAGLFVTMLVMTGVVLAHFGKLGIYALAVITGVTDVDPFIMGLTQSAGTTTPVAIAATGILIAASSNNLIKGFYAYSFARGTAGRQSLILLLLLALVGLLPLFFVLA